MNRLKFYTFLSCFFFLFFLTNISSQTFTVTSNGDGGDVSPGDGMCSDGTACTLRAAIEEANATGGTGAITIDFSVTGTMIIMPAAVLPNLTRENVSIDASTATGASCGTLVSGTEHTLVVVLDGTSIPAPAVATSNAGLTIATTNCTVKGLVIQNCPDMGIIITDDDNTVECCYIGTNQAGTAAANNADDGIIINGSGAITGTTVSNCLISGNTQSGIHIGGIDEITAKGNLIGTNAAGGAAIANSVGISCFGCTNLTIGGTNATDRNIISGNTNAGYNSGGTGTSSVSFFGNYIGTDITGENDLGNGAEGIRMQHPASNYTIGGSSAGQGNVISGNGDDGIHLNDNATVLGNKIGTDKDGVSDIGNDANGIFIQSVGTDNTIGGNSSADENIIAFNGADGIEVNSFTTTVNNEIARNSIFSNNNLGIDLGENGVTANDADDNDSGANNLQNFPDITEASIDGSNNLTVTYSVNSTTGNSAYPLTVRFFKADSGNEEGQNYLGEHSYTSGNAQNSVMTTFVAAASISTGDHIVATATDANDNTSEFSTSFVLPVELTFFRGLEKGSNVTLEWQTATEINNEGFEIQHSEKGKWENMGFVYGKGTTYETQNYRYEIPGMTAGSHTFRLKQTDFDGQFQYSDNVSVFIENNDQRNRLTIYPNPVKNSVQISLNLPTDQFAKLEIQNAHGQSVEILHEGLLPEGRSDFSGFDFSDLPNGFYLIQLKGDGISESRRVLKID